MAAPNPGDPTIVMEDIAVEVHAIRPDRFLAKLLLTGNPQPGQCIEVNGSIYRILERRHRYHLQKGKYRLHRAILSVQLLEQNDLYQWQGRWIVGNPECKYNARSEILRCAVNPNGSCSSCSYFAKD